MGCKMTKLIRKGGHDITEKGYDAPVPEPPPPQPLDPRLPLSARQKFSVCKSWKGINRAMQPTGVNMFLKLFEDNSDILNLFDKFKELQTRDQQAESLELAEHANIVMTSIDEGIRAMDNVDFFYDLLHQIGASHRRLPGFKKEFFWKIERPFLEAVKLTLDERYTENIEKVYKITIHFILETVIEGYDLAEAREVNDNVKGKNSSSADAGSPTSNSMQQTVNTIRMNVKSGGGTSGMVCIAEEASKPSDNGSDTGKNENENMATHS
ncbi:UNVERIFIED_CONTAM: hypothetical protein RMT77_003947 [Armadillidium vulgare]